MMFHFRKHGCYVLFLLLYIGCSPTLVPSEEAQQEKVMVDASVSMDTFAPDEPSSIGPDNHKEEPLPEREALIPETNSPEFADNASPDTTDSPDAGAAPRLILAMSESYPEHILQSQGFLYWVATLNNGKALRQMAKTGGVVRTLWQTTKRIQLVKAHGRFVYVAEVEKEQNVFRSKRIYQIPVDAPEKSLIFVEVKVGEAINDFVINDTHLYWSVESQQNKSIMRKHLQTSDVETFLGNRPRACVGLTLAQGVLFWFDRGFFRKSLSGGQIEEGKWSGVAAPLFAGPDGYWTAHSTGELGDVYISQLKAFGPTEPLVRYYGRGNPESVSADSQGLYFIDTLHYLCRVCFVPFAGPYQPTPVAYFPFDKNKQEEFEGINSIALDETYIYWTDRTKGLIGATRKK